MKPQPVQMQLSMAALGEIASRTQALFAEFGLLCAMRRLEETGEGIAVTLDIWAEPIIIGKDAAGSIRSALQTPASVESAASAMLAEQSVEPCTDLAGPCGDPPARASWPGIALGEGNTSDVGDEVTASAGVRPSGSDTIAEPITVGHENPETVIEDLLAQPAWVDVTRHLIVPLVKHGLRIHGDPRSVLTACAREFSDQKKRVLAFAAGRLTREGSRHRAWPVADEIYAALGRYKPNAVAEGAAQANGHGAEVRP